MSVLRTVKGVVSGFSNFVFEKEDIELIAAERRRICNVCPKSNNGNSRRCLKRKGGCGCILSLKTRVLEEECPDLKWKAV